MLRIVGKKCITIFITYIACFTSVAIADGFSPVESKFLQYNNQLSADRSAEKIPTVIVDTTETLGKITALRFIEWINENPEGVVSLPVGKSVEFFIRYLTYYKKNWDKPEVKDELESFGIKLSTFPSTDGIKLVQTFELFPIPLEHKRSIRNFLLNYYAKPLGIKQENLLLMPMIDRGILKRKGLDVVFRSVSPIDWSLMSREPRNRIEQWQQQALLDANDFCRDYEKKLRNWGGIGLYIELVGYRGDLALNFSGTDFNSKSRLTHIDYQVGAHIAKELGGLDFSKRNTGVTAGIGTIRINPKAKYIILINGESGIERAHDIIEGDISHDTPASILQLNDTVAYITEHASSQLKRQIRSKVEKKIPQKFIKELDKLFIDSALANKKSIMSLTESDVHKEVNAKIFLEKVNIPFVRLRQSVHNRLLKKVELGISDIKAKNIMHTGAYHDDIMLGYYPVIRQLLRHNRNSFTYYTSGVNSVSDQYITTTLSRVDYRWLNRSKHVIFNKQYYEIIDDFARSFWTNDNESMAINETVVLLKHLCDIYQITTINQLKEYIRWLKDEYFPGKKPGEIDSKDIITLKRLIRETESDKLWAINNVWTDHIHHLDLSFYSTDHTFHSLPTYNEDVMPVIKVINKRVPDIITIVDAPQDSGSDAAYKSNMILAVALRNSNIGANTKILSYRNFGYRYHLADADRIMLVTDKEHSYISKAFNMCFSTQREAVFPSPVNRTDLASLTINIQKRQFNELKLLLGEDTLLRLGHSDKVGVITMKTHRMQEFTKSFKDLKTYIALKGI